MKKQLSTIKQQGFTLIELLVVIGILGILAAALIATIDPFEQLKKADDAKIKNMTVEFQTALVRYYTTHGALPWNDPNNSANTNCDALGGTAGGEVDFAAPLQLGGTGAMIDCLQSTTGGNSLISEGELKASFVSVPADLNKIYVNWAAGDAANATVCFSPTSKSQKSSAETKYDSGGTLLADRSICPTAADGTCFWCTK